MRIAGIVAEYNPFHSGHAYQIKKTREAGFTHIAVVMSGNYTQRGEPACMPKEIRCRAALENGADLCLELPLPWAVSSAEHFASGAICLLDAAGCMEAVSFGSECGDAARIKRCARQLETLDKEKLARQLAKGLSFPSARMRALEEQYGEDFSLLANPNDTLGVEYCKALGRLSSPIRPFAVRRLSPHDAGTAGNGFASALAIREALGRGTTEEAFRYVPEPAAMLYRVGASDGRLPLDISSFQKIMLSYLRRLSAEDYRHFPDTGEGLSNRIGRAVGRALSMDELLDGIKTKRYTLSRIRRILLCAFLGCDISFLRGSPPYLRVLGFNPRGAEILSRLKTAARLPVVTRCAQIAELDEFARRVFALECAATDQYALCLPKPMPCATEKSSGVIKI